MMNVSWVTIAANAIVGTIAGGAALFITGELLVGMIVAVAITQYIIWFDPHHWLRNAFWEGKDGR